MTPTLSLENYPGYLDNSGQKLADQMHKQTQSSELIDHMDGDVLDIVSMPDNLWCVKTKKTDFITKTVLIASGTKEKQLNIPNEVEYYGNGVSYCAICDGNLYAKRDVVVVGGGNSAAEESVYLSKIVRTVNLVHRRHEFRADPIIMNSVKSIENIKINTAYTPVKVEVKDEAVIGLTIKNVEDGKEVLIPGDCIFFYIGLLPEIYFLQNLKLNRDEGGFLIVNAGMETNIPGIYAAGDITSKNLRQVVTAINDGAIAAISIKNYINEHS